MKTALIFILTLFIFKSANCQEKEITQFYGYNLGVSYSLVANELIDQKKYTKSRFSTEKFLTLIKIPAIGYKADVSFYFGDDDKLKGGVMLFDNGTAGEGIFKIDLSPASIKQYEIIQNGLQEKYGEGNISPGFRKFDEVANSDVISLLKNGTINYFTEWVLNNGKIQLSVTKDAQVNLIYKTENKEITIDSSIL